MENEKMEKIGDLITKQLELKNDFSKKFVIESLLAIQRFDEKHTEKGLGDYAEFGSLGVFIRMAEKYNQLKRIYKNNENKENTNKLWEDVSIYALMGKLVENGEWKEN